MPINNGIINQKGTPAFYSDIFANRPAFGYAGRVFISTDTGAIYEDTGSAWTLIADAGAGTTGTLQQVTTNGNTTTLGVTIQGIDINDGAGTGSGNTGVGASILLVNTTGADNTAIGKNSLAANTTGFSNTAIGSQSLFFNTTGVNNTAVGIFSLTKNTTGTLNTALGNNALQNNTTASYNTAIGSGSLLNNTTGVNNNALGYFSLLANTTGTDNTAVGSSALSSNTTANYNTAIGSNSLGSNTTGAQNTAVGFQSLVANTIGDNNVAIGQASLLANTSGSQNTALGVSSLVANTTGVSNTALGYQSLYSNTTGGNNIGIGLGSLANNTTASQNTAIGVSSMGANTTGASNTAVGYYALQQNTTGSFNVSIGQETLKSNTTANYNTGIGNSVLTLNTTGTNNTAIGQGALQSNTTANSNTAIGVSALGGNTTGTLNTAIGYSAGSSITTGSNNTILGNYAGTTTLASNIVLSDGAGNVRLFSDANGLIGINQAVGSTIGGQLDIHTTQTYALVLNGLSTSNAYTAFSNASVGKWRIGNTYNAGANTFDIHNLTTTTNAISINSTSNTCTFTGISANRIITLNAPTDGGYITFETAGSAYADIGSYKGLIGTGSATDLIISCRSTNSLIFGTNITERGRFSSGGNLLLGYTTDDTVNKLQVNGSIALPNNTFIKFKNTSGVNQNILCTDAGNSTVLRPSASGGVIAFQNYANNANNALFADSGIVTFGNLAGTGSRAVLADASGNLSAPVSDISVKENINTIGYGLNEILKMNPIWFDYNDEYKNYGEGRQNGNIAQEMEAIIPEAVFTTPTTGKMGINYDQLHAVYIKAIQELNEKLIRNNIN